MKEEENIEEEYVEEDDTLPYFNGYKDALNDIRSKIDELYNEKDHNSSDKN